MIRIEHLRKEYPNVTPLKDVNAVIHEGDVISVIGPSGTGKSTLLRCINMLEKPTSGKIWVHDTQINAPGCKVSLVRQKMGMVFQSFNLFPHLTVIENIMMAPVDLLKKSRQEAYEEGMRLLGTVGLTEKALSYPEQLSGGQKQRIAIARALAMNPEILLFDEPTSALDPTMVGEVQAVIRDLALSGKTMMIVTHEMAFARAICNRVFYMDEGGICEDGPPEQIFDHPKKDQTRRFVNHLKVLELTIPAGAYDFPEMIGQIHGYCIRNRISLLQTGHIELAFEELIQNLLKPGFGESEISLVIEYSETDRMAVFCAGFDGPAPDISSFKDSLPLRILKGICDSISTESGSGEDGKGRIVLKIPG